MTQTSQITKLLNKYIVSGLEMGANEMCKIDKLKRIANNFVFKTEYGVYKGKHLLL